MSKRGNSKDSEPYGSDAEQPPRKKPSAASAAGDDQDSDPDTIIICEISKNRRVSVRNWNGKIVVDIREFYAKDGKQLPGKKGISLTMDQWKVLRDNLDKIDTAVAGKN